MGDGFAIEKRYDNAVSCILVRGAIAIFVSPTAGKSTIMGCAASAIVDAIVSFGTAVTAAQFSLLS
jgi:hypothetical protein